MAKSFTPHDFEPDDFESEGFAAHDFEPDVRASASPLKKTAGLPAGFNPEEFLNRHTQYYEGVGTGVLNNLKGAANLIPGVEFKKSHPENEAGKVGETVGEVGSFFAPLPKGPQQFNVLKNIAEKSPKLATALNYLTRGAAFGAIGAENKEEQLPKALEGAAINSGLGAVGYGASKIYHGLKPTNIFRSVRSPEEIEKYRQAAAGTDTGLGNVLGIPSLKKYQENVLLHVPFSGTEKSMEKAAGQTIKRGEDLLSRISHGLTPDTVDKHLYDSALKNYENLRKSKNNLYKEVDEAAEKANVTVPGKSFVSEAKKYSDAIEDTNILKYQPELKSLMNRLGIYKSKTVDKVTSPILDASGRAFTETKHMTLKEANLLKGLLGSAAVDAAQNPDAIKRGASAIFSNLANGLKRDIKMAISKNGNEEVNKLYQAAESNYKTNFAPFLDKDIYRIINKKVSPDEMVQYIIKTSRVSDKSGKIDKLMTALPIKEKEKLIYAWLSRAVSKEGNLDPKKLNSLIHGLGAKQFKSLIPDEKLRNDILNYSRLYKMNANAVSMLDNPPTGQKALDMAKAAIGGGFVSGAITGGLPHLAGNALKAGATIATARHLNKKITNELSRDKFIKRANEAKPRNKLENKLRNLTPVILEGRKEKDKKK